MNPSPRSRPRSFSGRDNDDPFGPPYHFFCAQSRNTSIISLNWRGPPRPLKTFCSTLQTSQSTPLGFMLGSNPWLRSQKGTSSTSVSCRSISIVHPGLSKVPILMPRECSQSPLHWFRYHCCNLVSASILRLTGLARLQPSTPRLTTPGAALCRTCGAESER